MELFAKIVDVFQLSTILAESSILDVRRGFEYVSDNSVKLELTH